MLRASGQALLWIAVLLASACSRAPEAGKPAVAGPDAEPVVAERPSVTVSGDERHAVVGAWVPPPVGLGSPGEWPAWRARAADALEAGRLFEDATAAIPIYLALLEADPDDRAAQRGLQRARAGPYRCTRVAARPGRRRGGRAACRAPYRGGACRVARGSAGAGAAARGGGGAAPVRAQPRRRGRPARRPAGRAGQWRAGLFSRCVGAAAGRSACLAGPCSGGECRDRAQRTGRARARLRRRRTLARPRPARARGRCRRGARCPAAAGGRAQRPHRRAARCRAARAGARRRPARSTERP